MQNKTFSDFLDEVAKEKGYNDFKDLTLGLTAISGVQYIATEAAQLYADHRVQQFAQRVNDVSPVFGLEKAKETNKLLSWIRLNGEMSEDGKSITYNCDELEQAIADYCVEKAGEWVSLEERLPDFADPHENPRWKYADNILFIDQKNIIRSGYAAVHVVNGSIVWHSVYFMCGAFNDDDCYIVDGVTHWMNLPKAPKP